MRLRPWRWIGFGILLGLAGCLRTGAETLPVVYLSDLNPVPTATAEVVPLRVAVAAILSPQGTARSYQPLLDVLEAKLGRPVELVQRRTYAEVNELIRRGEVDLAFVCTRAYVEGQKAFGMELLAIPQIHGRTTYRAAVIVRKGYPARSFEDLRGAVFAFTDPLSNTGHLYPSVLVRRLGETSETFFRRTFFTYSHDNAIGAVADGIADAASVDSVVLDYALKRDPGLRDRIQVLFYSLPFGMPPVVVGPQVRPQTKARLKEILLTLHEDPEGQKALEALEVDRFVPVDDRAYDSVRDLIRELEMGR